MSDGKGHKKVLKCIKCNLTAVIRCKELSLTPGGAVVQDMITEPFLNRLPLPLSPLLTHPSSLQVTGWVSSTPPLRTSSATKAPTSSSSAAASWRPPIGWRPPSRTGSRAGRRTRRDWARAANRIITSNFKPNL